MRPHPFFRFAGIFLALSCLLFTGCTSAAQPTEAPEATVTVETVPQTTPTETTIPETLPPETTFPETIPPETTVVTTEPTQPLLVLTEEEQQLLLKIGMAEMNAGLGYDNCPECIALVMRTVLNRVESGRFSRTIRGVIYAPEQFTPVMDGSFESAVPNEACYEALDMVIHGWDESQGALFYEWCEGESWHSKNLNLLLQHCNTRFYN